MPCFNLVDYGSISRWCTLSCFREFLAFSGKDCCSLFYKHFTVIPPPLTWHWSLNLVHLRITRRATEDTPLGSSPVADAGLGWGPRIFTSTNIFPGITLKNQCPGACLGSLGLTYVSHWSILLETGGQSLGTAMRFPADLGEVSANNLSCFRMNLRTKQGLYF